MSRKPRYGNEIMIPSEHPDGHWCNGIVNAISGSGDMLVVAPGHAKSNFVSVPVKAYRTHWCWPGDVHQQPSGAKPQRLEDVEG